MRKQGFFLVVLCVVLCIPLVYRMISQQCMKHTSDEIRGLFSWSSDQLGESERDELFAVMEKMRLNTLYQSFSSDSDIPQVQEFLKEAASRNIEVWFLTGHPDWGLDPTGDKMVEAIRRAASYQRGLPLEVRFRGVLMDSEPYLTNMWDSNPKEVMDSWCLAMETAREEAKKENFLFAACIPYYLDTMGFPEHLNRLITNGCDALMIMNYYKKNEAKHIADEMEMAKETEIPVTVIYELQPPGEHDLMEVNTYYTNGLSAVEDSWNALCEKFGKENFFMAFHEYKALKEVMLRE